MNNPTRGLMRTAYVHEANVGQVVSFKPKGTRYVVQPGGAIKRETPKLKGKAARRAEKLARRIHKEETK